MTRALGAAFLMALAAPTIAAGPLEIEVATVRATADGARDLNSSDPVVIFLRRHLKGFTAYRGFSVVKREGRPCAWRSEQAFALPGGRSLEIVPKGMERQMVMMWVRLLDGHKRLVDTHVRLKQRGRLVFGISRGDAEGDGAMFVVLRAGE